MVGGALNASRVGLFREETLSSHHPIAEISQIQQFNHAIEDIILLWLLCLMTLIILGYV
jgi:hypothetical protein